LLLLLLLLLRSAAAAAAYTGLITPRDYVRITSTAAAQIYNIYPRKGRIAAGSDADVIVLDPRVNHTISAATHHSRIDTNVYEGANCALKDVDLAVVSASLSEVRHQTTYCQHWSIGTLNITLFQHAEQAACGAAAASSAGSCSKLCFN
jgi:formylmethanofuran dehydrogenase subunit A